MKTETTTQTLHFWTEGEAFTNLMNMFYDEGRFAMLEDTLRDGGLPDEMIKLFFLRMGRFTGCTKDGGDLYFEPAEQPEDFPSILYWALANRLSEMKPRMSVLNLLHVQNWPQEVAQDKDLSVLVKYISREQIIRCSYRRILSSEGYGLNPWDGEKHMDGAVLQNGDFVTCGFQEHKDLYPVLAALGLASDSDWSDDTMTFHVSSGLYSGKIVSALRHPDLFERRKQRALESGEECYSITEAQLQTLARYRDNIRGSYGDDDSTMEDIRQYIVEMEDHGGKWGNLTFLRKFYPDIKLPRFEKVHDTFGSTQRICLRTSPKHSIAGLLESKFDFPKGYAHAEWELRLRFEKFKDVRKNNELHYFYQEYIEGRNGVAHYTRDGFSYAVSDKQGDIVKGKRSGQLLSIAEQDQLRPVCSQLYKDLNRPVQVEFVFTPKGELYIVQLRTLENEYESTVIRSAAPANVIAQGRTFSKGEGKFQKRDILLVDEDCESEALIGKKALIVKADTEFSHILALSKALRIPSVYGVGDIESSTDWQDAKTINFVAYNKEGFICKEA